MKRIILSCIGIVLSPRRILPLPFRKKNISKKSNLKGERSEMLPFKSFLGPTFIRKSTPHSVLLNSINFIRKYLVVKCCYPALRVNNFINNLNSATLLSIKLFKRLSNKKLLVILPCQNFHLSLCCEKKTSKTLV